jgi:hypothetical protein
MKKAFMNTPEERAVAGISVFLIKKPKSGFFCRREG